MSKKNYSRPVARLLTLGSAQTGSTKTFHKWRDYHALGLTDEHIPELIELATDSKLNWAEQGSREVWAPLHAWRALAQLHATEAIQPLVNQIDALQDDDWFREDLPAVMELLGPAALPALNTYLNTYKHGVNHMGYLSVVDSIQRIGHRYIEVRSRCSAMLLSRLMDYATNDEGFNGSLVHALLDLRAREALPLIAAAFKAHCIDEFLVDWEDVCQTYKLPLAMRPTDIYERKQ